MTWNPPLPEKTKMKRLHFCARGAYCYALQSKIKKECQEIFFLSQCLPLFFSPNNGSKICVTFVDSFLLLICYFITRRFFSLRLPLRWERKPFPTHRTQKVKIRKKRRAWYTKLCDIRKRSLANAVLRFTLDRFGRYFRQDWVEHLAILMFSGVSYS